jgi:hypothetical protein
VRHDRGQVDGLPPQDLLDKFVDATVTLRKENLSQAEASAATQIIRSVAEAIVNARGGNPELLASHPQLAMAMGVYAEAAIRLRTSAFDGANVHGALGGMVAAEEGLAEVAITLTNGASAEAPTSAAPTSSVRTEPTVRKIAVVTGCTDARFAPLLTGVTGTMGENGFQIDPLYARISPLFELMEDGGSVNEASLGFGEQQSGTQVVEISVESDAQVRALQLQILDQRAKVWDKLYEQMMPAGMSQSDAAQKMLANERRKTATKLAAVRAEANLREFLVPVTLTAMVPQPGEADERYGDRATLLAAVQMLPLTVCSDVAREVLDAGAQEVLDAVVRELPDAPPADGNDVIDPAIAAHDGPITLEMSSWLRVKASTPDDARAVLVKLLELRQFIPGVLDASLLKHGNIDRAELDPRVTYSDDDGEDDDDDGYPGMRG